MTSKQLYEVLSRAGTAIAIRKACSEYFKARPTVRIGVQPAGVLVFLFGKFTPREMEDIPSTFYRLRSLSVEPACVSFFAGSRWGITRAVAKYQATLKLHDELSGKAHREYVEAYGQLLKQQRVQCRAVRVASAVRATAEQELAASDAALTSTLEEYCKPQMSKIDSRRSVLLEKAAEKLTAAEQMRDALFIAKV